MKVGDLVRTCPAFPNPDIGVIVEVFQGWRFRVMWSNGQSGVHNRRSLEVVCEQEALYNTDTTVMMVITGGVWSQK